MTTDCLFCRIARHDLPADIVYEDNCALALLDIHPRAPGHVFVIPKKHASGLIDLPEADLKPFFLAVQKVARELSTRLEAPALTIGLNQGRASGQEIDHLHVHILPRFTSDGGGSIQSVVNNPPDSKDVIRQRLGFID